jgi:hypothetical protein
MSDPEKRFFDLRDLLGHFFCPLGGNFSQPGRRREEKKEKGVRVAREIVLSSPVGK